MSYAEILPPTDENQTRAAEHLLSGGIVAYPTETVYGLGVDPHNEDALRKLFAIKGRAPDQPVLMLVADRDSVSGLASVVPPIASELMDKHWPAPLTLLLPAREGLSTYITSNSGTVAVRQASPGPATDLLAHTGIPITSTSANRSGEPPAETGEQAAKLFDSHPGIVIDGQCIPGAPPSTILDTTGPTPVIVREGAITSSQLSISVA